MEILKDYAESIREIDYIKEQIKLTQFEFNWWSGVDPSTGDGTFLKGVGVFKFGVESAMIQIEKKRRALNNLNERLEIVEKRKDSIEKHLSKFEGLEYQVAYYKYVDRLTLDEIADKVGYSLPHVKRISAKIGKRYRNDTDYLIMV